MLVHHCTNFDHWVDQLLRRQNITQSQGGVEDLSHCACVDNTACIIKPLQTREWGTGIPKFRVMVILKDVSVAGARKIDQSRPSRETHRHSKWELMRRSNIDYFRRTLFRWPCNGDPFAINRPWNDGRAGESKGSASLVKSRIFDPCSLSAINEGHRADHHCLLRASSNDDLVRVTTRTPIITQISCERFAQVGVATA